jgi:hypothetical protein
LEPRFRRRYGAVGGDGTELRITASFDHLEKAISLAGDSCVSFELLI